MRKTLTLWFLFVNIFTLKSQVCLFNEIGLLPNGSHNQIGISWNNLVKPFGLYVSSGGNCFDRVLGVNNSYVSSNEGLMNITTKYSLYNFGATYNTNNFTYRVGVGLLNTKQDGYGVFNSDIKTNTNKTEKNFNFSLEYKLPNNSLVSIGYNTKGSVNIGIGFPLSEIKNWKTSLNQCFNSSTTHGSYQCTGTTKQGVRCKNRTTNSNHRCHYHGGN